MRCVLHKTRLTVKPKLASRKKSIYTGDRAFVITTLVADLLRKNRVRYDELVSGRLVGEYDQNGTLIQEIVWLGDTPVATIRTDQGGSSVGVFYIHTDHLNAPSKVTRPSDNAVIWRWDHDPFGNGTPNQDPDGNGLQLTMNLRYPGQYFDQETGLYYNMARYYDAQSGRYLESDPIGLAGGLNTYAYVGGNPISNIDPSGLDCVATGNRVTCTVPGGGPTVTFPRPPRWPDTINPDSNFYHSYNIPVDMEGADMACVMRELANNPTPGNPSPATPNGTSNNATPNGAQNLFNLLDRVSSFGNDPGGYNNSPVISYQMGGNVVNVTQPGHPLHPGYVVRQPNGNVVNNYGEGTGGLQSRYSSVASQINGVWKEETKKAIEKCKCK